MYSDIKKPSVKDIGVEQSNQAFRTFRPNKRVRPEISRARFGINQGYLLGGPWFVRKIHDAFETLTPLGSD